MAKIAGRIFEPTRIIVINESDWTIEHNQIHSSGGYEIDTEDNNKKTLIARLNDGQSVGAGNLTPTE